VTAESDQFEPKLIYVAKRNLALSRPQFLKRWRQHGALGMSLPRWKNISRYVHCDVLHLTTDAPVLNDEYDGVGLIWHRSAQARAAHLADTTSRTTMERDEFETFAQPIVNSCLLAREEMVQRRDPPASSLTKLFYFSTSGTTYAASAWSADGIESRGHVVNRPLPPVGADNWGLKFKVVEEWWFKDADTALRAAAALESQQGASEDIVVMTNEVLLYDA
jgi:EthD domain